MKQIVSIVWTIDPNLTERYTNMTYFVFEYLGAQLFDYP